MSDDKDMTWHLATMVFGIDHSDPACPTLDAIFDAFVDATPEGLVDASHSMGPMESDAITVPAPTPDEDGVWSGGDAWTVTSAPPPGLIKTEVGGRAWLTADEAEALGAALIAAACDARRPSPMASERRKTNPHPGDYTP